MRMSLMPIAVLRRSLSAAVLASMFSLFVLYATDPVAARVVLSQCQRKHSYCTERCIMNNKTFDGVNACIKRTCDKQNPGCGAASIGKSGGGKLIQTNPGGSTGGYSGGGVLTSPSGGAGSWATTGNVFVPKSGGAVQKSKPHSQPKQTPTAEPKPAPTTEPKPTPTAEPKPTPTTPPARPTANVRDHRVTPKVDGDRSSPGVKTTRYPYDIGESDSGRKGPSKKRLPEIRDHRGVDAKSREGTSEKRKPEIRDHRAASTVRDHRSSSTQPKSGDSAGSNCGTQGNPRCVAQ